MEIIMTTGTRCFPRFGSFAMPGPFWPEQAGTQVVEGGRNVTVIAGRPVYRVRLRTLINLSSTVFPVTDRMCMSASEP
ncbi:MAG: hypothetical protein ACRDSP_25960 [Pseudonocardiaceae bacterium]